MDCDQAGFRLRHDPRRDPPEATPIRKQGRYLASRFLRSSGDENATRPSRSALCAFCDDA
jgi:hypothetical protein